MESIYLIFIVVLFMLAISDLIVGVSNDAVNFLNSAVGSKAAPLKIVLLVATAGVLAGTVFSGGMMEIARSGVFYPEKFTFADIMLIFLAVMITDVILLDAFNTIGFPTSTTVSLIFELLGASVAIAVFKIAGGAESAHLGEYINSGKALIVVSGILISVAIAFSMGAIIQYITRLIFSFNYEHKLNYLGGLFGGVAITIIIYFILIKGAKDAAFMTPENYNWVKLNSTKLLVYSFAGTTALLYLLQLMFRVNVLKVVVLAGTFALAMAFAGNDLVNFIGVPLAGYDSFLTFMNSPGADPESFTMGSLSGAVKTPVFFLLMSGLIMVVTLYKSRKARTVIMTEVNLSRQDEGEERFGSTALSRGIVRISIGINNMVSAVLPKTTKDWISSRFALPSQPKKKAGQPSFDLLRAAVNLVVSSALIAFGTSLKLPLSTTYVTFMVAMGTSLSDGAWDRESAVYRITGVFSVIGGWFFTALSAFTLAFILASFFFVGGPFAILGMILLAIFMAYRTHKFHLKKNESDSITQDVIQEVQPENFKDLFIQTAMDVIAKTSDYYNRIITDFGHGELRELRKTEADLTVLYKDIRKQRKMFVQLLKGSEQIGSESAYHVISTLDNMLETLNSLSIIAGASIKHQANQHKPFNEIQFAELKTIHEYYAQYFDNMRLNAINKIEQLAKDELLLKEKAENVIETSSRNEVIRIQEGATGNRSSILFMSILQETRNIFHFSIQVLAGVRNFQESSFRTSEDTGFQK